MAPNLEKNCSLFRTFCRSGATYFMRCSVAGAERPLSRLRPTTREQERARESEQSMLKSDGFRRATTITAAFLVALVAVLLLWGARPAEAAFPGSNGAIAYVNAGFQVFRMSPDGYPQTQLSNTAGSNFSPYWSANGQKIVFVNSELGNAEVYWMNSDGSGEQNLTNDPANIDSMPVFFPDHHKIAFTRNILGDIDMFKMTVNDSGTITDGPTPLTTSAAHETQPAVSPDGKKIAFDSGRSGNSEIYVMKARPEGRKNRSKNLTNNSAQDTQPAFSPDGRKIAFVSNRTGGSLDIFKMKADGSSQVNLTKIGGNQDFPTWQPDP